MSKASVLQGALLFGARNWDLVLGPRHLLGLLYLLVLPTFQPMLSLAEENPVSASQ